MVFEPLKYPKITILVITQCCIDDVTLEHVFSNPLNTSLRLDQKARENLTHF